MINKIDWIDLVTSSPELYDSLLQASVDLPKKASPQVMLGQKIVLRAMKEADKKDILLACNGSARFGESAYNPLRLFGWFDNISVMLLSPIPRYIRI